LTFGCYFLTVGCHAQSTINIDFQAKKQPILNNNQVDNSKKINKNEKNKSEIFNFFLVVIDFS
jgi:hypothetical protein